MRKSDPPGRINVSVSGGVATVEIENPAQRNAMTQGMCLQIQELMPQLAADPDVIVVALRGAGDTFCAGAPINDLASVLLDPQPDGTLLDHLSAADAAIAAIAKPTVALVDGACMGGGWQIASACDFIVASERSVFAITPAKIGVIYPRLGIERLLRQVGPATAKYILFTGQKFSAARAREIGLVADVVPDEEFEERSTLLLTSLTKRSRFTIHTLKHLVDQTGPNAPELDRDWKIAWTAMTASPDWEIGVSAFLNHAKPRFAWTPD
jgi:enoyl-CoA hydratase/carnithine racemase